MGLKTLSKKNKFENILVVHHVIKVLLPQLLLLLMLQLLLKR